MENCKQNVVVDFSYDILSIKIVIYVKKAFLPFVGGTEITVLK